MRFLFARISAEFFDRASKHVGMCLEVALDWHFRTLGFDYSPLLVVVMSPVIAQVV